MSEQINSLMDFNEVPVTMADQLKRVKEFLARLPKEDWYSPPGDVNVKADILYYLQNLVEQIEDEHSSELNVARSGMFLAFLIGELSAFLGSWDRETVSERNKKLAHIRWNVENAKKEQEKKEFMKVILLPADKLWAKGDPRRSDKMAMLLAETDLAKKCGFTKKKIMENPVYKDLAYYYDKLLGSSRKKLGIPQKKPF